LNDTPERPLICSSMQVKAERFPGRQAGDIKSVLF
jgi:hypothetical protein